MIKIALPILIILSMANITLYMNRERIIYAHVKYWNYEKIMESPENLRQFTGYLLLVALPDNCYQENGLALMPYKNLGDDLRYFVRKIMPLQWNLICKARELLKNKNFKIIYIPDKHYSSLSGQWNQESLENQKLIQQKIGQIKPQIALVEGLNRFLITREAVYREVTEFFQQTGMREPSRFEFTQTFNANKEWWMPFIGNAAIKLYGADITALNNIWFRLQEIGQKRNGKEQKLLQELAMSFNFYWRDLVVLAGAVETMQENNVNELVLVFGYSHAKTLSDHCQRLGIEFQQIDL